MSTISNSSMMQFLAVSLLADIADNGQLNGSYSMGLQESQSNSIWQNSSLGTNNSTLTQTDVGMVESPDNILLQLLSLFLNNQNSSTDTTTSTETDAVADTTCTTSATQDNAETNTTKSTIDIDQLIQQAKESTSDRYKARRITMLQAAKFEGNIDPNMLLPYSKTEEDGSMTTVYKNLYDNLVFEETKNDDGDRTKTFYDEDGNITEKIELSSVKDGKSTAITKDAKGNITSEFITDFIQGSLTEIIRNDDGTTTEIIRSKPDNITQNLIETDPTGVGNYELTATGGTTTIVTRSNGGNILSQETIESTVPSVYQSKYTGYDFYSAWSYTK